LPPVANLIELRPVLPIASPEQGVDEIVGLVGGCCHLQAPILKLSVSGIGLINSSIKRGLSRKAELLSADITPPGNRDSKPGGASYNGCCRFLALLIGTPLCNRSK
jgi:hypothetical protein